MWKSNFYEVAEVCMFRFEILKTSRNGLYLFLFFHCLDCIFVCIFIYQRKKDLASRWFSLFVCFIIVSQAKINIKSQDHYLGLTVSWFVCMWTKLLIQWYSI